MNECRSKLKLPATVRDNGHGVSSKEAKRIIFIGHDGWSDYEAIQDLRFQVLSHPNLV